MSMGWACCYCLSHTCKICLLHRIIYLPLMYIFEFLLYILCDVFFMHWRCQWDTGTRICLKCYEIFKIVVIITYAICLCNHIALWHDWPLSFYYILFRIRLPVRWLCRWQKCRVGRMLKLESNLVCCPAWFLFWTE